MRASCCLVVLVGLVGACAERRTLFTPDGGGGGADAEVDSGTVTEAAVADTRRDSSSADTSPPDTGVVVDMDAGVVLTDSGRPAPIPCPAGYTLTMIRGNGAAVLANNWSHAELVVLVRCGSTPIANVPIAWETNVVGGSVGETASSTAASTATIYSDSDGIALAAFRYPSGFVISSSSSERGETIARVGASSVRFLVTAFNPGTAIPMYPGARIITPESAGNGAVLGSFPIGVTEGVLRVAVAFNTGSSMGRPVPDIGIQIIPATPGTIRCRGDIVLTNAEGIATCDLEVLRPGEHIFELHLGSGLLRWFGIRATGT